MRIVTSVFEEKSLLTLKKLNVTHVLVNELNFPVQLKALI